MFYEGLCVSAEVPGLWDKHTYAGTNLSGRVLSTSHETSLRFREVNTAIPIVEVRKLRFRELKSACQGLTPSKR